tara:strand:+ start:116 stop:859 length:744 start_codon:yes stop_codon:yes gene_type:complete
MTPYLIQLLTKDLEYLREDQVEALKKVNQWEIGVQNARSALGKVNGKIAEVEAALNPVEESPAPAPAPAPVEEIYTWVDPVTVPDFIRAYFAANEGSAQWKDIAHATGQNPLSVRSILSTKAEFEIDPSKPMMGFYRLSGAPNKVKRRAYKPKTVNPPKVAVKAAVKKKTIRAGIREYFAVGNPPANYRDIAAAIERSPGSVNSILSQHPEFLNIINGLDVDTPDVRGLWGVDPRWVKQGWVITGKN